jgi:hypothetical protein
VSDDQKPADVVDLSAVRMERDHEAGHAAHAAGEAFKFEAWEYDDDAIGFIDGPYPLAILFNPEMLAGVVMTKDTAERLVVAIQEALKSPHAPWNESEPSGEDPDSR